MEVPKKSDFEKINIQEKYKLSNSGPNVAIILVVGILVIILAGIAQILYWNTSVEDDSNIKVIKRLDFDKNNIINEQKNTQTQVISINADPFTKLLLHFDNFGSDFIDSARSVRILTYADTTQSSVQSKFGGRSAYFDGKDDYLSIPTNSDFDFGTGDFTIDFWYFKGGTTDQYARIFQTRNGDVYAGVSICHNDANNLGFYLSSVGEGTSWEYSSPNIPVPDAKWTHFALVRKGNNINIYKNGERVANGIFSAPIYYNPNDVLVFGGRALPSRSIKGYLDEFRISKGVARWTSNFIPPVSAYSLSLNDMFIGEKVSSTCLSFKNELKYLSRDADTNNEVSILQDFLKNEAYVTEAPSGLFGLSTVAATKEFQKNYGLEQTGYLDSKTKSQVEKMSCYSNYEEPETGKIFYNPKQGDVYLLGDIMKIKWEPTTIDVSTIYLVGSEILVGNKNITKVQIYEKVESNEQISKAGEFSYKIEDNLIHIYPGKYKIELDSLNRENKILGEEFEIKSPVKLLDRSIYPFDINIVYLPEVFNKNEDFLFKVKAREGDGSILKEDPAKIDSSYAIIAEIQNNNGYDSHYVLKYDKSTETWNSMIKMPNIAGKYFIKIVLSCNYPGLDSVCLQKYGAWNKVEKQKSFEVI